LLKNAIHKVQDFLLKKKTGRRQRVKNLKHYDDIKQVGILYDAKGGINGTPEDFIRKLQHENKQVKALGFIQKRNINPSLDSSITFDYFTEKDLNWMGKPSGKQIDAFLSEKFDILLDLTDSSRYAFSYITGMSEASLKIGKKGSGSETFYDLMIELKPGSSTDAFLKHVDHYLRILKPAREV